MLTTSNVRIPPKRGARTSDTCLPAVELINGQGSFIRIFVDGRVEGFRGAVVNRIPAMIDQATAIARQQVNEASLKLHAGWHVEAFEPFDYANDYGISCQRNDLTYRYVLHVKGELGSLHSLDTQDRILQAALPTMNALIARYEASLALGHVPSCRSHHAYEAAACDCGARLGVIYALAAAEIP